MKISALVTLFALFGLAAAAAPVDSDMQFVRALREQDPKRRAEALLTLAERKDHPADLALIHLTREKLPPKSLARLLPLARFRFGELVPTVLLARAFRAEDDPERPEPMPRHELLNLAHTAWKNAARRDLSPFERRLFRELSGEVITLSWECGETNRFFPEVEQRLAARGEKWTMDFPVNQLLEFCYRHAFVNGGYELYCNKWGESEMPARRIFAALLDELEKCPPRSDRDTSARINFLLAVGEGHRALMLAANRLENTTEAQVTARAQEFFYTLIEAGDINVLECLSESDLKNLLGCIRPPNSSGADFPIAALKAAVLTNAGKFREALALLPQIPAGVLRANVEIRCRMALGEFDAAAAMATDPKSNLSERMRIFTLLEIAEIRRDPRCVAAAERIAGKKIDTDHSLSNAFGYVALIVGSNRDLAEKRIAYALSIRPRAGSYLDSMAWARYCAGDYAGAWKYMEESLRYCDPLPESCELLSHAGAIRLALGDRDGARRFWEQALGLAQAGEKTPKKGWLFRRHVEDIRKHLEQLK